MAHKSTKSIFLRIIHSQPILICVYALNIKVGATWAIKNPQGQDDKHHDLCHNHEGFHIHVRRILQKYTDNSAN